MSNAIIQVDQFSKSMREIIDAIPEHLEKEIPKAVSKSVQSGRKRVRENIAGFGGWGVRTGRYIQGWASRREQRGNSWVGYVYNKDVPGLAHLLEKGHAKVGGGRVSGREHIAPAAKDTFEEFEKQIEKAVSSI